MSKNNILWYIIFLGDSGGSLYVRDTVNNKPKFINVGLVSYGNGCGREGNPGINTRTAYFLDWIIENSVF